MTKEARDLRGEFEKKSRQAADAIDAAMAKPEARVRKLDPEESGIIVRFARELAAVSRTAQQKIEGALNGASTREVKS